MAASLSGLNLAYMPLRVIAVPSGSNAKRARTEYRHLRGPHGIVSLPELSAGSVLSVLVESNTSISMSMMHVIVSMGATHVRNSQSLISLLRNPREA
jgi:hypothetical protein